MKRTKIDFSRHELEITTLEITPNKKVRIHTFKRPDTTNCMLVFINACGVMTVTGDFGNWVFCREFHPSANGDGVSGGYWDEKLEIASVQKSDQYDSEKTMEAINDFKNDFEDNYGRPMSEEEMDWVERLEGSIDDEHEYVYIAYRENPSSIDYESVPFGKKRHVWLDAVYDGFNEICAVMKREGWS
jgi:hypothetical protein